MVGARSLAMALNRLIDAGIDAREPAHRRARDPVGEADDRRRPGVLRRLARGVPDRRLAARPGRALAVADPGRRCSSSTRTSSASRGSATSGSEPSTGSRRSARGWRSPGTLPWQAWALGGAVATWVAGFDIFYSLFDVEIDRAQGLHSWAVRFGERGAFVGARCMHVATVALLVAAGVGLEVDWWYWAGVVAVAGLLAYEHSLVRPGRPAAARRRVLHDERRDQRRVLRFRPRGRP